MLAATISFSKIRLRQNSEIKMAFNICTKLSKQPLVISHNRTNSKNLEYSEKDADFTGLQIQVSGFSKKG